MHKYLLCCFHLIVSHKKVEEWEERATLMTKLFRLNLLNCGDGNIGTCFLYIQLAPARHQVTLFI